MSFPTTGVLDNFNRGDGAIGAAWSGDTGAGMFLVASNKLDVLSGGLITWNAGKFGADQEAFFTYSTIDTDAGEINLVLKQQTAGSQDEMIEVLYSHANTRVEVWTNDTPTTGWTQRGANITGITLAAGDVFGASVDAAGLCRVYVNGTEIGNRDCSAWPHYASTGYIGIWVLTAGDAILDDFGGGDIVSGGTPALPGGQSAAQVARGRQISRPGWGMGRRTPFYSQPNVLPWVTGWGQGLQEGVESRNSLQLQLEWFWGVELVAPVLGGAGLVAQTLTIVYDMRSLIAKEFSAIFDLLNTVAQTKAFSWDIAVLVAQVKAFQWDIAVLVAQTKAFQWDILSSSSTVAQTLAALWDILNLISQTKSLQWDIRVLATQEKAFVWDLLTLVSQTQAYQWDIRSLIANQLAAVYDIRGLISQSKQFVWDLAGAVSAIFTARWDLGTPAPGTYRRPHWKERRMKRKS